MTGKGDRQAALPIWTGVPFALSLYHNPLGQDRFVCLLVHAVLTNARGDHAAVLSLAALVDWGQVRHEVFAVLQDGCLLCCGGLKKKRLAANNI